MNRKRLRALARIGACAAGVAALSAALAQTSTVDEIAKYRAALQDGNPAELWEARGEELWKQKRGPKQTSLEQCDLGLGAGSSRAHTRVCRDISPTPTGSWIWKRAWYGAWSRGRDTR